MKFKAYPEIVTTFAPEQFREFNDGYVTAAVAWVRALLTDRMEQTLQVPRKAVRKKGFWAWLFGDADFAVVDEGESPANPKPCVTEALKQYILVQDSLKQAGCNSSISQLVQRFDLSEFEKNILLLCLAYELDTRVGWLCGGIQDKPHRPYPTFGLAMLLFEDGDWSALLPERPLRQFRLLSIRQPAGTPLFAAELQLEETVLHYLRGVASVDHRITLIASPLPHRDE